MTIGLTEQQQEAHAREEEVLDARLAERQATRVAEPRPTRPGPPGVRGRPSAPAVRQNDYQRIQAAVAFHLGAKLPGIEWTKAADPLASRFAEMTAGNPQLISALEADVNTLFAMTDEEMADRILRGEPLSQFGDIFDAITEVSWEVGATDLAATLEAVKADSVKGTFDALTRAEALTLTMPDLVDVAPGQIVLPDQAKAQTFQTLFDVPGAWSHSGNTLAVTVGDQTVGIETRPGFDPENHLDVIAEVVSATQDGRIIGGEITGDQRAGVVDRVIGKAHQVGAWVETHPAAREFVDFLWRPMLPGSPGQELDDVREGLRDDAGAIQEQAVRQASLVPFPEEAFIASIARLVMADTTGLTSGDALTLAAETVAENRDQFESDFERMTQEELVSQLEAEIEGASPLGRALEAGTANALEQMQAWENTTQWIGVNTIDAFLDVIGVTEATRGAEGFDKLGAVFQAVADAPEADSAAEYFDLTGASADIANLAVGIGFDPLNLIFPSAKGLRGMAMRMLTEPEKYGRLYLRTGAHAHLISQIAETSGPKAVRNVGAIVGMDTAHKVELVKLALDPNASKEAVEDVFLRAMTAGDYIGDGAMRPIHLKTTEGVGRMIESVAGNLLDPESMDTVIKAVSRLSVQRSMPLGENVSLNSFEDVLTQLYPADKESWSNWFLYAAGELENNDLALVGAAAMQKEAIRRELWNTSIRSADDLKAVTQNMSAVEESLTQLDTLGLAADEAANVRSQLERMHNVMSRRVDEVAPRVESARAQQALARKKLSAAKNLESDLAQNAGRNTMTRLWYELMEEQAVRVNKLRGRDVIPVVADKINKLAPGIPVRDWSEVSLLGQSGFDPSRAEDVALSMGIAGESLERSKQLDAVGLGRRSQHVTLPVSPYELVIYEKLGGDAAWQKFAQQFRRDGARNVGKFMRRVFGVNLLLNPISAGRINLDPTLRFLAETGQVGQTGRAALAGFPGVGRVSEAAVAGTRQLASNVSDWDGWFAEKFGGPIRRYASRFEQGIVNPHAAQYGRQIASWSSDDFGKFTWIERPARRVGAGKMSRGDYREHVERFVNGTILNEPLFQHYARFADEARVLDDGTLIPPEGFVGWWEHGDGAAKPGKSLARHINIPVGGAQKFGTELTATEAFNIIGHNFELWLDNFVDDGVRTQFRRMVFQGLTEPGFRLDLKRDARLLNAVKTVPGLDPTTTRMGQVFDTFFGSPSARTTGVFYEQHYNDALDTLRARHASKLLTEERLMDFAGVDQGTARFMLKRGTDDRIVADLVQQQGMRLESQLAMKAAAVAQRKVDDYLYRFTAASLAGRGVEAGLIAPYATAQVDFLSWWFNHLTKPMTLPLTPDFRAKLAQFASQPGLAGGLGRGAQTAVQAVERIPLNARALAKYAHIVANVHNDETESWVDQMVDHFTFLPMRYGSDILLDVTPQLGPTSSLLMDGLIELGAISEDMEKHLNSLFPALAYTDLDNPAGLPEEFLDRWIPNSNRSLRDFSVSSARGLAGVFGDDIHTNPELWGQMTNLLADHQKPYATGDFQASLIADFFAEHGLNVTPGSTEWNDFMRDLAVEGAVEANKRDWSEGLWQRSLPLAGVEREYRAMGAFEGLMSDGIFGDLMRAGVWESDDLHDVDGEHRVKGLWDKYQSGEATPEDLSVLSDRLYRAYFQAGDVELLPGFSYRDWLHLNHPEMAVNLIQKSTDSGIPVRSDEHSEFKSQYINKLTGRLQNIPPGEAGRELVREARSRGWITSRPPDSAGPGEPGWAFDAASAVSRSHAKALRGVWEVVSGRTWQQGLTKTIAPQSFTMKEREAKILTAAGLTVTAGTQYSYGEFHELLDAYDERFDLAPPRLIDSIASGAVHADLSKHDDKWGQGLLENLAHADREFSKIGFEGPFDWPEAAKQKTRDLFSAAIDLGHIRLSDYRQEIEPLFGAIDYAPPVPPAVDDLEHGLKVQADEVMVVDGDTVAVMLDDGPLRVRLMGLSTPEVTQTGYGQARDNLARIIADADEVVLGIYQPDVFGLTQQTAPGEQRLNAFLYIDGRVLYDPSVFTADDPRGAGAPGTVRDLEELLAR